MLIVTDPFLPASKRNVPSDTNAPSNVGFFRWFTVAVAVPSAWTIRTPAFVALLRQFEVPVVFAEHGKYPAIADIAADFVYARLQRGSDEIKTCYPAKQLDAWAKRFQSWAAGGEPHDLPRVDDKARPERIPRDVFAYLIHEGKVRAPAGAMELIARVK